MFNPIESVAQGDLSLTPEERVHIFARLLITGWLDGRMSPETSEYWGTQLGHWFRIARVHRDVQAEVGRVLRGSFGVH